MPGLDTTTLKNSIKTAFLNQRANTDDPEAAANDLANEIGDAMEIWVKTLLISYTSGLANGAGAVTGTMLYTLS